MHLHRMYIWLHSLELNICLNNFRRVKKKNITNCKFISNFCLLAEFSTFLYNLIFCGISSIKINVFPDFAQKSGIEISFTIMQSSCIFKYINI